MRFIQNPEYLKPGARLLFREGRTKGIGSIVKVIPESENVGATPDKSHPNGRRKVFF